MNNKQKGSIYENLATQYLEKIGHTIVAKNYRNKFGEIDIISEYHDSPDKKLIVFHEIKYRKNSNLFNISDTQITRIHNSSQVFIATNKQYMNHTQRFDAIFISSENELNHIKNCVRIE